MAGVNIDVARAQFPKTTAWLKRQVEGDPADSLDPYGQMGVDALSSATPEETGLTSSSWNYRIIREGHVVRIEWYNTNAAGDESVAVLLQYGHGTGTGGYVQGTDYINPAMHDVFEAIHDALVKEMMI